MLLRLTTSAARLTLMFTGVLLASGLAFFSIRNAWTAYDAALGSSAGYDAAVRLESSNPENWYLLGRYWQYSIDDPDVRRAIRYYRAALLLNPRYTDAWMDLGAAYESEGDMTSARDAFLQAKRVYPISAEVSWRYGNFLLRQGQAPEAFSEIRRAVHVDPRRSAEAFSRCWRVDPDIHAILDNVLSPNLNGYLDVIHELSD